jgi:UDP-glucuronate 4-epimerase
MIKILITGHRGFIGQELCRKLKNTDIKFDGYDLKDGQDIRSREKLNYIMSMGNYDMVVHLAALAGVRRSEKFYREYIETNVTGTKNIIEACQECGIKGIMFFSSSSVLGSCLKEKGHKEDDRYDAKSLYAITKMAGEAMIKNSELEYMIIRPFTVYGPEARPDMLIYKWINKIREGKPIEMYGDGRSSRGYTFVGDLTDAVIKLIRLNAKEAQRTTVHLGGSEVITLKMVFDIFQNTAKKKIEWIQREMPKEDVMYSFADTGYAKRLIGFNPPKRFKKTLKAIIAREKI